MQQRKHICTRCQKGFSTAHAKQQHVSDSLNHHICRFCPSPLDYPTEEDLNKHLEDDHDIYTTCNRRFSGPRQLLQHDIDKHNMCASCRRYFDNPSNLKSVRLSFNDRWREAKNISHSTRFLMLKGTLAVLAARVSFPQIPQWCCTSKLGHAIPVSISTR